MAILRLNSVELHTGEVERLARFYTDAIGLELGPGDDAASHYETFWGSWGDDDEGEDDFLFFAVQPLGPGGQTRGVEVGFTVDDLDAAHARAVAAGAEVVEPPTPRPWGTAATYRDPDGNLVQLTQAG